MNKLILLSFLVSHAFAIVVDPNGFVESIEEKHLNSRYDECQDCNENSDIYLCVESLCGVANPENSTFLTGADLQNIKDPSIDKQFEDDRGDIKTSFEKSADFSRKLLAELEKRAFNLNLNSTQKSGMILKSLIPHLDVIQSEDGGLSISYDQNNKLNNSQRKIISEIIKKVKIRSENNFQLKYELGLPIKLEELKTEIKRIKELVNNKEPKADELNDLMQGLLWIESQTNQYNPSPKSIYNTATFLANVSSQILPILDLHTYPDLCVGINCDKFINEVIIPEKKEKLVSFKEMIEKLNEDKINELTNKCRGAYYYDDIESEFVSSFMFTFKGKERVLNYIKSNYSEKTYKMVSDYFGLNLNIKTDNRDVFNQDDVDKIKRIASDDTNIKTKAIEKMSSMSDYELMNNFNNQFYYDRPIVSQLQMFCSSDMSEILPIISDHYQPVFDKVQLSHFSCNHPNIGQDIFAHELGHVFSELVSRGNSSEESAKKFLERRQCVSSLYKVPDHEGAYSKKHPFDHFRTEEDMADFFAAQVHNFKKDKETGISMCALLPVSDGAYQDISIENRSYDNHSSAFIRIIREAYFKGVDLGENCQRIMKKNQHLWDFKDCK